MKTILLAALILIGCSAPEQTEIQIESKGYLSARGESNPSTPEGKTPVPDCSPLTPDKIVYTLIDESGKSFTLSSDIVLSGDTFTTSGAMEMDAGDYDVIDAVLFSGNTVTHVVPDELDPRYPFANYVKNALPYPITIVAGKTLVDSPEALCYTAKSISINGELGWDGTASSLSTMIIATTPGSCVNRIEITFTNSTPFYVPLFSDDVVQIPMPQGRPFEIRAYNGNTELMLFGEKEFITGEIAYTDNDFPEQFTENGPNPEYSAFINSITYFIEPICE